MSAAPPVGPTTAAPTSTTPTTTTTKETETERLSRELAELKAELAKAAATKTTSVEDALRKELADLRAASSNNAPVAEHLAREALYKREPYKATLDRQSNLQEVTNHAERMYGQIRYLLPSQNLSSDNTEM